MYVNRLSENMKNEISSKFDNILIKRKDGHVEYPKELFNIMHGIIDEMINKYKQLLNKLMINSTHTFSRDYEVEDCDECIWKLEKLNVQIEMRLDSQTRQNSFNEIMRIVNTQIDKLSKFIH